jgi:excisionase family DNA binding protein
MTKTSSPPRPVPRVSLTRAECARAMGVSVRVIDQLLADRSSGFPRVRVGRKVLIPLSELESWLRGRLENGKGGQVL